MEQRQRIGPARPHHLHLAEEIAETARELGVEVLLVERQDPRGERRPLGPDDPRAVAGHRQDGEGPAGRKCSTATPRCGSAWRTVQTMPVCGSPRPGRGCRQPAQRRLPAVARRDQLARHAPRHRREGRSARRHRARPARRRAAPYGQARQGAGTLDQRAAQHAVLDDIAQGRGTDVAVVVMQEERRIAVGDADLEDGLGLLRHAARGRCHASTCFEPSASGGAAVERLRQHRLGILAVDHRHLDARGGAGDSEGEPGEPAADDDELDAPLLHDAKDAARRGACPSAGTAYGRQASRCGLPRLRQQPLTPPRTTLARRLSAAGTARAAWRR